MKKTVDHIKEEYGLLGIVDIVLNHTANNSSWLLDHPESSYNTDDCPHLHSSYLLDRALSDFSDDYAQRKVSECPSAPSIATESDLQAVMLAIRSKVIARLNLQEFFMFEVEKVLAEVRDVIRSGDAKLE